MVSYLNIEKSKMMEKSGFPGRQRGRSRVYQQQSFLIAGVVACVKRNTNIDSSG